MVILIMKVANREIERCKECPACEWRGECNAIPRKPEDDFYCSFTYHSINPEEKPPEECPLLKIGA